MATKILCPILRNLSFSFMVPKYHPCTISFASFSNFPEKKFQYEEIKGDLFACKETDALAHCVSADLAMGKGIAVVFKKKFGEVRELKNQGKMVGDVAVLKRESRFVYYLITKEKYSNKPTYETLTTSLKAMKKHSVEHNVECISMPKIGCGLDGLQWEKVSAILKEVFNESSISIKVYALE